MKAPVPTRRWYQFSLRTLLVFVTLCAIACSWLAVKMRQAERQRKAVEAIEKLGGRVQYDWQFDATGNPIPNAKPRRAFGLRGVLGNQFYWKVTAVALFSIEHFTDPGYDSKVTDNELESIRGLSHLRELSLNSTHVTDTAWST